MNFRALDLTSPVNRLKASFVCLAINVRAYLVGGFQLRNVLTDVIITISGVVNTLARLNDTTPAGPSSGFTLISSAGGNIYNNATEEATGLSGNPVSLIPFRPNTSVQPWEYIGDSAPQGDVTLFTKYLGLTKFGPAGTPVDFVTNGMNKIRSDGLIYKMGVKEPQLAPTVTTENSSVPFGGGAGNLLATTIPWNNYLGANPDFNFGQTDAYNGEPGAAPPFDGTAPFIVNVLNASTITVTVTGSAFINGGTHAPSDSSAAWVGSTFPGNFIRIKGTGGSPGTASVVIGAFIDASGNVMPLGVAPLFIPSVVDIGAGGTFTVPVGAVSFDIGINSAGNTYHLNSGSFTVNGTVNTSGLSPTVGIIGSLNLYYWGDSPLSGPVAQYIWKNPDDTGTGTPRSISNAVGNATGNSFIFDATFTAGIPSLPGVGNQTIPMQWTVLNADSVAVGSNPVFAAPITATYPTNTTYSNFNFCLFGNIYIPDAGYYTFTLTSKDQCIWGIEGGTVISATATYYNGTTPAGSQTVPLTHLSEFGQTETVAQGYPLFPKAPIPFGGNYYDEDTQSMSVTVVVQFGSAGIYGIEIDYDYWFHSGRILLLMGSPTASASTTPFAVPVAIISPGAANTRQEVQYRYVYRSSATGATSNPSPESEAITLPVAANTITSLWSNDPQIDFVDYYRLDSTTSDFTYVATGPNDDLGTVPGTNTPITDSLTDLELSTQLLDYDNFEPFPSIDLPQKGIVNVSGGVITWVSGGSIGGNEVGFNLRWLAGTIILIGSPTSLPYVLIARPTPAEFQTGSPYALNFVILDPAGHYQLVTIAGVAGGVTPIFNDTGGVTISGGVTFQDEGFFVPNGFGSQITIPGVPDASDVVYTIAEPTLAAQPLAYLFGPTDNINYAYGVGDPLRPGTLYWSKGSNLDAAPDTNQLDVTDPSEALVNGAMAGGQGVLFSIKRAWLIAPNFFNALATATGTTGSTWSLQETAITRGLFIPRCVAISGGGTIFFRVDDGWHISPGGQASKSITDETLYPLFPHEGSTPVPITRNGTTIYPPNDSLPQLQKASFVNGYMYWDYYGTDGNPHTLVFDEAAMGWIWDTYTPTVTVHAPDEGESTQGCLVGCSDGTIRQFSSAASSSPVSPITTQLGLAANYALLAYSGITNSGTSVISGGNIGSSPTPSITGFPPGVLTSPSTTDNAGAVAAQVALTAAIIYYQGLTPTLAGLTNLSIGGNGSTPFTYTPGVYVGSTSLIMPTGITLDAKGNPNATFVFVAGSTINLASGQSVALANGARASNVVFVAGSAFTSVATSVVNGNVLAVSGITLGGGGLNGRALVTTGPVTIAAATTVIVGTTAGSGTEAVTGIVLTAAVGGVGWGHFFELTVEYSSMTTVALSFIAADTGNGSYAPPPLILPATNGIITKFTTKVGPNKWKLLQIQFQSSDPLLQVYIDGTALAAKSWGDSGMYESINPFSGASGGFGGQV